MAGGLVKGSCAGFGGFEEREKEKTSSMKYILLVLLSFCFGLAEGGGTPIWFRSGDVFYNKRLRRCVLRVIFRNLFKVLVHRRSYSGATACSRVFGPFLGT